MTYKSWVSVHFRKRDVQIEMNMQDEAYTYRLVYRRERVAPKGVFARRQLRSGSSIGRSGWGDTECATLMNEFYAANKGLLRDMGEAWLNQTKETDDVWSIFRDRLELNLTRQAATA